ncbi:MAG TPA: site-2 protease family protein [Polyangiaceae bacterium]
MEPGVRIGRIFGIDIRVDGSWLVIFALMTWSLGSMFAARHQSWSLLAAFGLGLAGSLLFFVSVVIHELAHSAVAIAHGLPVRSVTLFLFGGISNIEREPESPRVEFLTAAVGPLVSILLGSALLVGTNLALKEPPVTSGPDAFFASLSPLESLLVWLGTINVAIGGFNLVPAFPLDGGRLLRSALWSATKSLRSATQTAANVSRVFAWLFILLGLAMSFGVRLPLLGSGLGSGLWLAFVGWFLNGAASSMRSGAERPSDRPSAIPPRALPH